MPTPRLLSAYQGRSRTPVRPPDCCLSALLAGGYSATKGEELRLAGEVCSLMKGEGLRLLKVIVLYETGRSYSF